MAVAVRAASSLSGLFQTRPFAPSPRLTGFRGVNRRGKGIREAEVPAKKSAHELITVGSTAAGSGIAGRDETRIRARNCNAERD